ncbi:MAG: DUF2341 domain-containing protein, partial [Candidatus Pacebacteria bacterium]|nr:DUF2341 domain-containing protein [Candidatus Paceibacterota bacterium]
KVKITFRRATVPDFSDDHSGNFENVRVGSNAVHSNRSFPTPNIQSLTMVYTKLEITSISPNIGSTSGSTPFTITGLGIGAGATVTIGGSSATNVFVVSQNKITGIAPSGTAGAKDIVVTNPISEDTNTLTGGFTYLTSYSELTKTNTTDFTASGSTLTNLTTSGIKMDMANFLWEDWTPSTTGGSIAANTYYYVVTATDFNSNETVKGPETAGVVTTGSTSSVSLNWRPVQGATGYKVYRSTTSGTYSTPALIATISRTDSSTFNTSISYTDTSASASAGAPPGSATSVGEMAFDYGTVPSSGAGTFSSGPTLTTSAGSGSHSIQRPDGKFLVMHGSIATSIYDPVENSFASGPSIGDIGFGSHSIQRPDGKFLVIHGETSTSTYIYDPVENSFASGPTLTADARWGSHSLQRPDGKFLIVHGFGTTSTSIYDPMANSFASGPTLTANANYGSHSIQRPDGKFLIIHGGGADSTSIYDPVANSFASGPTLTAITTQGSHSIQRPDGKFLVIHSGATSTSIYDAGWLSGTTAQNGTVGTYESENINPSDISNWEKISWVKTTDDTIQASDNTIDNVEIKTATTEGGLTAASYRNVANGGSIGAEAGEIWMKVKITFRRITPDFSDDHSGNFENVRDSESAVYSNRPFPTPDIQSLTMVYTAVTSITIAGTSADKTSGTVKVAVNGSIQAQTGTIAGDKSWSIASVTVGSGNTVTVWVDSADDNAESTAVTKYDGTGNIAGMVLTTNILSVGSDDTGVSLTVANLGQYDCIDNEDVMHNASTVATTLEVEGIGGACVNSYVSEKIDILSGDILTIGGTETLSSHDIAINGTLTSGGNSIYNISGSWDNNSTFTASTSTVEFTASSGTETLDSGGTGAGKLFNDLTHSGASTLQLSNNAIDVNGNFSQTAGIFDANSLSQNYAGNFSLSDTTTYTKGGTLTFDGVTSYNDANSDTKENIGTVVASGTSVTLASSMTVDKINVSAGTLDLVSSGYVLTLAGSGAAGSRPFIVSGTLTEGTNSTVSYIGTSATDIEDETYYHLEFKPTSGSPTYTLGTAGSQTITSSGNFTVGNGSNAVTVNADTYDPTLDVVENFTISAGAGFTSSATGSFSVGGNWSNSATGTFTHSDGTVTFDEWWSYKKSHVITNNIASELTNYQVKIVVDPDTGSDSGNTVYCDGKCQTDYDDIRFTDANGIFIDYWIEDDTANPANIWVEVPTIPSSSTATIYMLYGNDAVSTTSSGDDTFNFFDDFPGSSIDTSKWEGDTGIVSVSSSVLTVSGINEDVNSIIAFAPDKRLKFYSKQAFSSWTVWGFRFGAAGSQRVMGYQDGVNNWIVSTDAAAAEIASNWNTGNVYTKKEILWGDSFDTVHYIEDGVEKTNSPYTTGVNIPNESLNIQFYSDNNIDLNVDWVFVSEYTSTEPSHTSWGSETIRSIDSGGSSFYNITFNDPYISINGAWSFGANSATVAKDFTITAGAVTAPSTTLTIAEDFTNSGTFTHNSGTVTFDTAATSQLAYSASTTFYGLTSSTTNKTIQFEETSAVQTIVTNTLTLQGGDCDNKMTLDSLASAADDWEILVTGATVDIDYVDVQWSTAVTTAITDTYDTTDDNNNNTNWTINAGTCGGAGITISGIAYTDDGSTTLNSSDGTFKVVNNTTGATSSSAGGTDASGNWSITGVATPSVGDILTIWINEGTDDGTLVVEYGASCGGYTDCTGLHLYEDRVILRSENDNALANSDFANCDNDTGTNCTDSEIGFTSNAGALETSDGRKLILWT